VTGLSLTALAQLTSAELPLVRVVPNTPCVIGKGVSVLTFGGTVSAVQRQAALQLFSAVGKVQVLPENLLNAVTALSGSGPAYVFLLLEALSDAGVRVGLPRQVATDLAIHTVEGAAKMVAQTGQHPAELKDRVTSPGGTTIAGLHVLEESKVRAGFYNAVQAAYERACQLGGCS
jgi:pyrroline-5-carboxylate reductase